MKLKLIRKWLTKQSTIGELYINGIFECYTLEDVVREPGVKVYGKTAIPRGRYSIIIDDSVRFGRRMPHLLDVPGYSGVRIHSGNTAADTDGCILVGEAKGQDVITQSKDAFATLFKKLDEATEPITIEVA